MAVRGIHEQNYSTALLLSGAAPLQRVEVPALAESSLAWPPLIEVLQDRLQWRFPGLTFASAEAAAASAESFTPARALLSAVPGLSGSVATLVRSVHVLSAPREMDVSHSDPEIPFSIFVSIPPASEPVAAIRLMESVLHEAMHLQLSLIEAVVPLILSDRIYFSPWQNRSRPAQGLLHGLYVFAVIHEVFRAMQSVVAEPMRAHIERRMEQIAAEVQMIEPLGEALTEPGRSLADRALAAVQAG